MFSAYSPLDDIKSKIEMDCFSFSLNEINNIQARYTYFNDHFISTYIDICTLYS